MSLKNLKTSFLIFILILFSSSGFSLAELNGVYDADKNIAPEGELPETKNQFSGNVTVVIDATSESLPAPVEEVQAQFTPDDGGETINIVADKLGENCPWYEDNGDLETGCRYGATFDVGEYGSGNYTVGGRVNYRALDGWSYTSNLTTLTDNEAPKVSGRKPQGGVNPEDPISISLKAFDEHSGVNSIKLEVVSGGEVVKERTAERESINLTLEEDIIQERSRYEVLYEVQDLLENNNSGSWEFYTDKSYTGDRDPNYPDEGTLKWPQDSDSTERAESMDLKVEYQETEENYENFGIRQTCYHDGEEIYTDRQESPGTNKEEAFNLSCELSRDRFMNEKANITFQTCDVVGNCMEKVTKIYRFDGDRPEIQRVELPAEKFSGEFLLDIEASDQTSEVEKIRYRYEDHSAVVKDYRSNRTLIEPPDNYPEIAREYPLTVQAVDSSGQRSRKENLTVEFVEPGDTGVQMSSNIIRHNISINTRGKHYSIDSEEQEQIEVGIENREEVYLSEAEVEVDSKLLEDTKKVKHIPPEEEKTAEFDVKTVDYGKHSLEIKVKGKTVETSIIVEPTVEQVKEIVDRHEDTTERYQEIQEKINEIEGKPMDESKKNRLKENLTKLQSLRSNTSEALDESNYHVAVENFEKFEKISQDTEGSYNQYMDSYRHSRWIGGILLTFGGIIGLIILLEAFFQTSDEYDISFTDIEYIRIAEKITENVVENIKASIRGIGKMNKRYGIVPSADKVMALMSSMKAKSKGLFYDGEFEEYED